MQLAHVSLLVSFASLATAASLNISISLPIKQCGEVDVNPFCGEPPCTISLRPSNDTSAELDGDVIVSDGGVGYSTFPEPEGSNLTFWIVDNSGQSNHSEPFVVQSGDSACLASRNGSDSTPPSSGNGNGKSSTASHATGGTSALFAGAAAAGLGLVFVI